MSQRFIICISGESGVGKSTIAKIISLYYKNNTTTISSDDLHKWIRTDIHWNTFTHLNPEANNLELGDIHLKELSLNKSIYRSVYNHKTGYFEPPIKIEPKSIIINEGLHAFFTEESKNIANLKIYIDTSEDLTTHWKIIRDVEERGYKYSDVLETINKRKIDGKIVRDQQISCADVIISVNSINKIKFLGSRDEKIDLSITINFVKDKIYEELFSHIEKHFIEHNNYIKLSNK